MLKSKSIFIATIFLVLILVSGCVETTPELDERAEKIKTDLIARGFTDPTVSLTCDTLSLTVSISKAELTAKIKTLGEAIGSALQDNPYVDNVEFNINVDGFPVSFSAKTDDVIDFALGKLSVDEFYKRISGETGPHDIDLKKDGSSISKAIIIQVGNEREQIHTHIRGVNACGDKAGRKTWYTEYKSIEGKQYQIAHVECNNGQEEIYYFQVS